MTRRTENILRNMLIVKLSWKPMYSRRKPESTNSETGSGGPL